MHNCRSADRILLEPGMTVWVENIRSGYPPKERTVGKIINDNKIEYDTPDNEGYIGARAQSCWVSLAAAMSYALHQHIIINEK